MDCDLQDPPEEIPRLYEKAREGYDIVLARRVRRTAVVVPPRSPAARTSGSGTSSCGRTSSTEYGTFSLLSRKVVDAFLDVRDRDRHYMLILYWLGFERAEIEFEHAERIAGTSSYTMRAADPGRASTGFFFETTILLRWIVYLGFALALARRAARGLVHRHRLPRSTRYPGWTSLAVLLLIVGGFIIIEPGVTGLYIGKIFGQVKDRPLYVVDERRRAERAEADAA